MILHSGNYAQAERRLSDAMHEFETIGMASDAALVSLDMAEALLALGEKKRIAKVAAHAFRVLKKARMMRGALTALAYLKESAANGRVKRADIDAVRKFIQRVEREPELVFLPPRETSD